jgi:NADH-quinone oxidoreductase subunit H
MNLITIGNMQSGLFTNWLIFHDPFTFCVFWVYFTCAVASVNRAPFDLAEAESELVAGFHTEYSGLRWSFFFMAEYGSMLLVSGLASVLFFGGWNGPFPIFEWLGWSDAGGFLGYLARLGGCVNFLGKAMLGVIVMMWARWTLPRLRIDQVMTTCLKYCMPLAAICFVGALAWQTGLFGYLPQRVPSINDLFATRPRGEVREPWAEEESRVQSLESRGRRREAAARAPRPALATGLDTKHLPLDSRLQTLDSPKGGAS